MIGVLDRHIARLALSRWLAVLFVGTFLVLLGDFVGRMGAYLEALFSARWWLFLLYEAVRLPGFVLTWLPLSTLAAALITAASLINQGTLTALGSSGIPPARAFRPFLLLALASSAVSFALSDQLLPRLGAYIERVELAMEGKATLRQDRAKAAGWRSGGTVWSAALADPANGAYSGIAAFRADATRRMLMAEHLTWNAGRWQLAGVVLVEGDAQRTVASALPADLGFELGQDAPQLAEALRSDDSRTSGELFAAGAGRRLQVVVMRVAGALLPLLCLLYGLPRFVRWADRGRLGVTGAKAVIWAAAPLLATALLSRLLVSAGAEPVYLAVGMLGMLLTFGIVRWRRMRL